MRFFIAASDSNSMSTTGALGVKSRTLLDIRAAALFGLVYLASSTLSGFLTQWTNAISYVWLSSGLYVGALILNPPRRWIFLIIAGGLADWFYNLFWDPWPLHLLLYAHL